MTDDTITIQNPPKPKWEYSYTSSFHISYRIKDAPNKFHRIMQRIVLGIYWRKLND